VQLMTNVGRFDEATAECQAMLKEYPEPNEVRNTRQSLSSVYTAAGKHLQAEEQLQMILDQDPTAATASNDLGYIWGDQGKHLPEAERLIRKALNLDRQQRKGTSAVSADSDRDNAAYVDSLGWVLFRRGHLDEARKALEEAVTLPGGDDDPV